MDSYLDINDYPKVIKPTYSCATIFVKKWFQIAHQNFVHHQSIDTNKQTMWPVLGEDLGFLGPKPNNGSMNQGTQPPKVIYCLAFEVSKSKV